MRSTTGIARYVRILCKDTTISTTQTMAFFHLDVPDFCPKKIRPHRRCKGRDHPDGISQLRFRFTWGGALYLEKTSCF